MEKIEWKLAGWKKLYLYTGCRSMLLKSTLYILPTYFLSLFTIPTHVPNKIEKLQRDFLWGDSKISLVGWDKVCAPSIRPYWGNGCGGLGRKRIGYGIGW